MAEISTRPDPVEEAAEKTADDTVEDTLETAEAADSDRGGADDQAPPLETPPPDRTFRNRLGVVCLVALATKVAYILLVTKSQPLAGDALYYSAQGQVIADGRGFAQPFYFAGTMPAADHPPLAALFMSLGPLIAGFKAMAFGLPAYILLQRFTMAIVGTLTVAVIGLTGRRVGGDRVGLVAAGLAMLHPSLWVNDGILMSESVAGLALASVILVAVIAVERRTLPWWAALGASIGVAGLARSESTALFVALTIPLVVVAHRDRLRDGVAALAAAAVAGLLVCGLWVVPNLLRYEEPVLFSTNDGLTLIGANCPETYAGESRGLWTLGCLRFFDTDDNGIDDYTDLSKWSPWETATEDPSELSARYQSAAREYIADHAGKLPELAAVRVARTWGLYQPVQMAEYNRGEGRSKTISLLAWAFHLFTIPLAFVGLRALRASGVSIIPFVAQAAVVTFVSAIIYGLARFRLGWDVAACTVAAVGIVALVDRLSARRSGV